MSEEANPKRLSRRELRLQWQAEEAANQPEEAANQPEVLEPPVVEEQVAEEELPIPVSVRSRRQEREITYDSAPTQPYSLEDLQQIQQETQAANEVMPPAAAVLKEVVEENAEREPDSYSFPDIKPLEEDRSIFDDDNADFMANIEAKSEAAQKRKIEVDEDFHNIIEMAIEDESISVHNNTAALILPVLPDTDLTGPIGTTGELFITGSFELPKSLSETGGHSSLLDSLQSDFEAKTSPSKADDADGLDVFAEFETTEFDVQPKSARKAVSAKPAQSTEPTTPVTKPDNKKPLVFILVGGGIIILLAAGGILLSQSGLFG